MIDRWIAEATECDFKVALEVKKPKSWLKSVSAFANGIGGTLFFGIDNDRNVIGLTDAQADAETISRLIKERITPYPNFILAPERENGKDLLVLSVTAGRSTPYYYTADGITEAYIRIGNESVIAPSYVLNQLLLKGMNRTYDALDSEYDFKDYAFSKLRERYKVWTGNSMEEKLFDSFEMRDDHGKLTNAGALLADDAPIKHSRLFCTRWNGLDKSGGMVDALDSAEYSGSLIILLNEGVGFVKRNMKTSWKKTANSRIEMPDYCERSVFEALVNALIHRDYLILGSEVHIDIYDDRLTITSPGGMADGTRIQERDISNISSTRRNPVLADIFGRLGYMERQGSGFKKITEAYRAAHNYRDELEPKFYSDASSFQVTLYNLNFGQTEDKAGLPNKNQAFDDEKTGLQDKKQAFESLLAGLGVSAPTRENMLKLFQRFGFDIPFARADVMQVTGITATPATELMRKMKEAKLIESAKGRGKYKFIEPID
ncbi:putative DNA binding domain-containing protein [Intestinimonas massiliensis]|uniref:DNA binding domain-containing protein n=1 Tax=Intestinimonas massiliensis (ex Afouda et al. 2020) TaxID=1673721 RepID=A0ABS9MA29_9FIRM|nr:ATP-binding protein [Intestinimonas massiliensis (ex Afouda et al. 2020)]MCG4527636.1 putative DNA binding domain-containing protein [Intestinimonas massiliensis (ex Afouda et al. 2020)]MCQ4807494.1 putative DNA binding domain-containing protein [Intestinimonas massiliensis (ex Afouda et al. 2020)]